MKKFICLCAFIMLTGCIGGTTPQSHFYALKPVTVSDKITTYKTQKMNISIDDIRVPNTLDRPQIVTIDSDNVQVHVSELNRWSETFPDLIRQTIAADIGVYLPMASIKPWYNPTENYDYTINVGVTKFWGSLGGKMTLEVFWSVKDKNDKTVVSRHTKLIQDTGKTYADMVVTQSDLIAKLSGEISEQLARLK